MTHLEAEESNKEVKNKELDFLLIEPPYSMEERYGKVGKTGGETPPLGLLMLAAYLIEKNCTTDVLDAPTLNLYPQEIIKIIEEKNPKVIGLSSLTSSFHNAVSTATEIKNRFPDKMIFIGGHHATILPIEVMKEHKCFDLLIYGEGEFTSEELMKRFHSFNCDKNKFLSSYETLESIKGIVFRKGESVVKTDPRPLIEDVDILPLPARHLVPMDKYTPLPNQYKRLPSHVMVVIRGCPFNCSFCSNNALFGRKIRARSPQKVVEEIEHLINNYGAKEISFWDDMLTANKKWLTEMCNLIIEKKLDLVWTCYARADSVNKETLEIMKKAGCWNIFFGFEAGDQQLLDNINKRIKLQDSRNVMKWCKEIGIEVRGSFMLALPGETPELAMKTINFAIELNPDYAQFTITTPFPGTALYETAEEYGSLKKDYLKYNNLNAVFIPFGYKNEKEIVDMQKKAMRKFYFRFGYIVSRIKKIKSMQDVKRYLAGLRFLVGLIKSDN